MKRSPTYYQLLEVSRTASTAQIRAAYLRLVKRYHPDVAHKDVHGSDFLPRLNEMYKALSDPVKRAAYDAGLSAVDQPQRALMVSPQQTSARKPLRRGHVDRRWAAGIAAGFALGAAIVLVRIANSWVEPADGYSSQLSAVFALPPPEKAAAVPFPSPDAIGRYARLGANLPIQLAEERSRQCFFHARQLASRAAAQLCVVLDDAFLYSRSAPPSVLTMYFDDVVVALRHSSALDIEPNDALLRRLRQASFAALMAEFRGAAVEPPANENAASTPLPPPQSNSGRSRRNTPS